MREETHNCPIDRAMTQRRARVFILACFTITSRKQIQIIYSIQVYFHHRALSQRNIMEIPCLWEKNVGCSKVQGYSSSTLDFAIDTHCVTVVREDFSQWTKHCMRLVFQFCSKKHTRRKVMLSFPTLVRHL